MDHSHVLLELLNSRLGDDDELGDDAAAAAWLRQRDAPYDAAAIADARAVRDALAGHLRGETTTEVLHPWVSTMERRAEVTDAGLEWADATPGDRRFGAAMIEQWATLQHAAEGPRLRSCAAPDCQHFLIDSSRANNRRWHSMETCGNRAKARRHYARAREVAAAARDGE